MKQLLKQTITQLLHTPYILGMLETAQFTGEFLWAAKKLPLIYWYYCCLAVKGAVTSLWYFSSRLL